MNHIVLRHDDGRLGEPVPEHATRATADQVRSPCVAQGRKEEGEEELGVPPQKRAALQSEGVDDRGGRRRDAAAYLLMPCLAREHAALAQGNRK